jgi:7,8-dihydropterin-6-yl-methyl-4-(beta-D-ribofuranosyl)aminobenzene 5'-phosphate synthase
MATKVLSNEPIALEELDSADVFVLIDNVSDGMSSLPEGVTGEVPNLVKAGAKAFTGDGLCCACWGLSLVLTARVGPRSRCLLFDAGPASYAIDGNVPRLGIDMGAIEAAVLSHGHIDHAGGLPAALRLIYAANGERRIPVHANPGMFVHRGEYEEGVGVFPLEDIPSSAALSAAGGQVVDEAESQLLLDKMFYLSGEIPRVTTYETGLPGHLLRTSADGEWEPDPWLLDERFVAVHVKGKGIIVFSACSHAGIVNVLLHARDLFDPIPLYGVMGGFHLAGSKMEKIIPETIEDLRQFDLKMIVPGHCTGWRAVHALLDAFSEEVVIPSAVGRLHEFVADVAVSP